MERAKKVVELCKFIDYTNLKLDATHEEVYELCKEAQEYEFHAICVNPYDVIFAYYILGGERRKVKVCSVVDFPLGKSTTEQRLYQIRSLLQYVDEFDVVASIGALKNKHAYYLKDEFKAIRELTEGKVVKIIIEAPRLDNDEIVTLSNLIIDASLDFIKDSTGKELYVNNIPTENLGNYFNLQEKIKRIGLIKEVIAKRGATTRIKAAGGIRTIDDCMALIAAGASRIGTSVNVLKRKN